MRFSKNDLYRLANLMPHTHSGNAQGLTNRPTWFICTMIEHNASMCADYRLATQRYVEMSFDEAQILDNLVIKLIHHFTLDWLHRNGSTDFKEYMHNTIDWYNVAQNILKDWAELEYDSIRILDLKGTANHDEPTAEESSALNEWFESLPSDMKEYLGRNG